MAQATKPILDTKTKQEYPTMYQAGKALGATLVPEYTGAARLVWFAMVRKYPGRFQTKSVTGEWVELNDPSVPKITRVRKTLKPAEEKAQLLQRLGELQAAEAEKTATKTQKGAAAAVAAEAEAGEAAEEAVEEVEEEAAAPTPGPAKPKLAAAMAKK